jgi:integrase
MNKNFLDSLIGRPNTLKTQKCLFSKRIEPYLDTYTQPEIRWIEWLTQTWLNEGLKPGTVKQLISLTRRWIQWTYHVDVDCRNLTTKIGRLERNKEVKVWTKEESKQALDTARHLDGNLYRLMLFTLHTGLRKSEMFALTWRDLDLVSGKILIRNSKTGRPRSVPMSEMVEELFQKNYIVGAEDDHLFSVNMPR